MVVRKLIGFFTALVWASLVAAAPSPLPGPVVSVDALDDLIKKQGVTVLDLRPFKRRQDDTPHDS
ncbi:MAG: hypothetical protein VW440_06115 [Bordetella sp.]